MGVFWYLDTFILQNQPTFCTTKASQKILISFDVQYLLRFLEMTWCMCYVAVDCTPTCIWHTLCRWKRKWKMCCTTYLISTTEPYSAKEKGKYPSPFELVTFRPRQRLLYQLDNRVQRCLTKRRMTYRFFGVLSPNFTRTSLEQVGDVSRKPRDFFSFSFFISTNGHSFFSWIPINIQIAPTFWIFCFCFGTNSSRYFTHRWCQI